MMKAQFLKILILLQRQSEMYQKLSVPSLVLYREFCMNLSQNIYFLYREHANGKKYLFI